MSSMISICNLALSNLGKDNINDLSEASAEARACNQFYGHVLDTLLQAYPWKFATKTASLAELQNDKPGHWTRAYKRPTDCLKIQAFVTPTFQGVWSGMGIPYDVEGSTIYCDVSPAFLRYTYSMTDATRFSPMFAEAFAWHLAVRLAMPLTRDPKVRADAYQLATRTQAAAEAADANEVRETSDIDSEFLMERG